MRTGVSNYLGYEQKVN